MKNWILLIHNKKFVWHLVISMLACLLAFQFSNKQSYAMDKLNGPSLSDLILDHLPYYNGSEFFAILGIFTWFILLLYYLTIPQQLPFLLTSFAIFFSVRACFISLTHMGPPAGLALDQAILSFNMYQSDLFFSGHTGAPFFLACLSKNKWIKYFCIGVSLLMGFSVLLFRLHYSIDVFAAFFISHSLAVLIQKYLSKLSGLKIDYLV